MKLPTKKKALEILLQGENSVFVHLNPRGYDVTVPPRLKGKTQIVLQLGLDMPVPIRDLTISEKGWSAGLSFGGQIQYVSVPWEAVFAMVCENGKGVVWSESVPPEMAAKLAPAVPAPDVRSRDVFLHARDQADVERRFDGEKPADAPLAKVISLAGRKPRAKA